MNQQYLIQTIPQIIDLFENMPTQSSLNVAITAFKPFEYTFLSADQVNTMALTTLPLLTATNVERTVDMSHRYLMVRAEQPLTVSVHVTVNQTSAEPFSMPVGATVAIVIVSLLIFIIIVMVLYFLLTRRGRKKQQERSKAAQLRVGYNPANQRLNPPRDYSTTQTNTSILARLTKSER